MKTKTGSLTVTARKAYSCEVQLGQRLAASGIAVAHCGQSLVVTAAGAGLGINGVTS
jgi:hypothetical protein